MERRKSKIFLKPATALVCNLSIRVSGAGEQVTLSHAYLIDDSFSGLSTSIGTVVVHPETTSLLQLRDILEYDSRGTVKRRSLLFQEAMFIMQRLPRLNPTLSDTATDKYVFGYAKKGTDDVKMFDNVDENKVLSELLKNIFEYDIVLIPLSQLPP